MCTPLLFILTQRKEFRRKGSPFQPVKIRNGFLPLRSVWWKKERRTRAVWKYMISSIAVIQKCTLNRQKSPSSLVRGNGRWLSRSDACEIHLQIYIMMKKILNDWFPCFAAWRMMNSRMFRLFSRMAFGKPMTWCRKICRSTVWSFGNGRYKVTEGLIPCCRDYQTERRYAVFSTDDLALPRSVDGRDTPGFLYFCY